MAKQFRRPDVTIPQEKLEGALYASNQPQVNPGPSAPTPAGKKMYRPASGGGPVDQLKANAAALQEMRAALDAGQLSVADFVAQGQDIAKESYRIIGTTAGQGSNAANQVNPFIGTLAQAGFKQTGGSVNDPAVQVALPTKYQGQLRDALLPGNLDPEVRKRIIESVPDNIDIQSDQGRIEQERIRQLVEAEMAGKKRADERQAKLGDLEGILGNRRDVLFERNKDRIKSEAQAAGILNTSSFGDALASNLSQLEQDAQYALSTQALSDRDVNINEATSILDRSQAMQTSGLERTFGREDQDRSLELAMKIAELSKPQPKGKTGTEKAYDGATLLANGISAARGIK